MVNSPYLQVPCVHILLWLVLEPHLKGLIDRIKILSASFGLVEKLLKYGQGSRGSGVVSLGWLKKPWMI
jgi:hypothetical protein